MGLGFGLVREQQEATPFRTKPVPFRWTVGIPRTNAVPIRLLGLGLPLAFRSPARGGSFMELVGG